MITSDEQEIFYYGRISNEHKIYTLDLFDAIVKEISALHQRFLSGDDSLYKKLFELEVLVGRIVETLRGFHRAIRDELIYGLSEYKRIVDRIRGGLVSPTREIRIYPSAYRMLYRDIEGTHYQNGEWDEEDWLDFRDDLKLALQGQPTMSLVEQIANYDFDQFQIIRVYIQELYRDIIQNLRYLNVYEDQSYSFRYTQESLMINSIPIRILGANLLFGENERLFRRFAQAAQYFIDRTAELFPILLDHQRPIELPINEIVDSCGATALACYLSDSRDRSYFGRINYKDISFALYKIRRESYTKERIAKTIAHEMGHFWYREVFSESDVELWKKVANLKESFPVPVGEIYNSLLKKTFASRSRNTEGLPQGFFSVSIVFDVIEDKIKKYARSNDTKFSRTELVSISDALFEKHFEYTEDPDKEGAVKIPKKMRPFAKYKSNGQIFINRNYTETFDVPFGGLYVSEYGKTNEEELFCEAIGHVIAYGSRNVDHTIMWALKKILQVPIRNPRGK